MRRAIKEMLLYSPDALGTEMFSPIWIVLVAMGLGILAPIVVMGGTTFFLEKASLAHTSKVALWLFVLAVQGATWGLSSLALFKSFRKLNRDSIWPRGVLLHAILPLILVVGVSRLLTSYSSLSAPTPGAEIGAKHVTGFGVTGTLIAAVAVLGMFIVRLVLLHTRCLDIEKFIDLQNSFDVFFSVAAAILSLGVAGTMTLRNAINSAIEGATPGSPLAHQPRLPSEIVLLWGGLYTVLLVIAYFPVKLAFLRAGSGLLDTLGAVPGSGGLQAVSKWAEQRSKLEDFLRLNLSTATGFLGPAATLLPFFLSLLSAFWSREK